MNQREYPKQYLQDTDNVYNECLEWWSCVRNELEVNLSTLTILLLICF